MKKISKLFSPDIFRIICILYVICMSGLPFLTQAMTPYLKFFHIYAALVILVDLFGERRILRNKGRILLVVFVLCYAITLLQNRELMTVAGISDFCYILIALAVIYSYTTEDHLLRAIGNNIFCWLITAMSAVSLWMFFEKKHIYIESAERYIGIYFSENRLSGIFASPAVLGMMSLIGIVLGLLLFAQNHKRHLKWIYLIPMLLNLCTMLLANARAANYAFILFCVVFVFCLALKKCKGVKGVMLALCFACVTGFLAGGACKLVQYQLSYVDQFYTWIKTPGVPVESTTEVLESESLVESLTTTLPESTVTETSTEVSDTVTIHSDTSASTATPELTTVPPAESTTVSDTVGSEDATTSETVTTSASVTTSETVTTSTSVTTSETVTTSASATTSETVTTSASAPITTTTLQTTKDDFTFGGTTIKRNEDAGLNGRLQMWVTGAKMIKHQFLFGFGLNNYESAFEKTGEYTNLYNGGFHNTYLDILVAYGLAGFLCLFFFLLGILLCVIRYFRRGSGERWGEVSVLVAVVFAYLLYAMAESTPMFAMNHTGMMFWYVMAQLVSLLESDELRSGTYRPGLLFVWLEKLIGVIRKRNKTDRPETESPSKEVEK